jgi:hypothetical protein
VTFVYFGYNYIAVDASNSMVTKLTVLQVIFHGIRTISLLCNYIFNMLKNLSNNLQILMICIYLCNSFKHEDIS